MPDSSCDAGAAYRRFRGYSMVNHPGLVQQANLCGEAQIRWRVHAVAVPQAPALAIRSSGLALSAGDLYAAGAAADRVYRRRLRDRFHHVDHRDWLLLATLRAFRSSGVFRHPHQCRCILSRPTGALCTGVSEHADNNGRAIPRYPGPDMRERYPSLKFESGFPHEIAASRPRWKI